MCKITLIRHGQASFGAKNYDVLSDLGKLQAAAVGEYFAKSGLQFDDILHGELSRQLETAQIIAKGMQHQHPLTLNSGLNEFDSENLVKHYLPIVAKTSVELETVINGKENWFFNNQHFEFVFKALINAWQTGASCPFESWQTFHQRVVGFFNEMTSRYVASDKIAVVTSGGLITLALQLIMQIDQGRFADINLTINNTSLTDLRLLPATPGEEENNSDQRVSAQLLCFNNISPLIVQNDRRLITRK